MFQVQFITHFTDTIGYAESARIALEGGCRWIQLRMKDASDEEVETVARQVQAMCHDFGAYFVLDDRVELVKRLHTDGVHLGKLDMPSTRHEPIWDLSLSLAAQQIPSMTYSVFIVQGPTISDVALFAIRQLRRIWHLSLVWKGIAGSCRRWRNMKSTCPS